MRRPHRNIEIFSMSVLDMFASALGAFIMVTVILFPYYRRDVRAEIAAAEARLETLDAARIQQTRRAAELESAFARNAAALDALRQTRSAAEQCARELAVCRRELGRTFLLVQASWNDSADINLEVIDPAGHIFSWDRNNRSGTDYPDTQSQLSIDIAIGPGIEVWMAPNAPVGKYELRYSLSRPAEIDIGVDGFYFTRSGRETLPHINIRTGQSSARVGMLDIQEDGTIIFEQ